MPDENTNPMGVTQTSQNNQATMNSTGDDFTLDFGGGEDKKETTLEGVETGELNLGEMNNENESGNSESEINLGFDEDRNEGENQENNINIQDLDSLFNEKQNNGFDISLDSQNENKQGNLEEQEEEIGENNITISNDENKVENNQKIEEKAEEKIEEKIEEKMDNDNENDNDNDNDNEDLVISSDNIKQEDIEKEQNNEGQGNDNMANDNFTHIEEENTKNEEINKEVMENSNNIEGNTENDIPSGVIGTNEVQDNQEIEENISDKNIGDLVEEAAQGDDFSISFDDAVDLSEDADDKLEEKVIEKEVKDDIDNGNQNSGIGNDEKAKLGDEESLNLASENATDEETLGKNEDIQETNPEITESEGIKPDIPSNQEAPTESKIEEIFKDESNNQEIGTGNEDISTPIEIKNNEEVNDGISTENPVNDEKSDNKKDALEQTKIASENFENHDNKPDDFIMNFNLEEDTDSQPTKQPEIGDFSVDVDTPIDENKEGSNEYENHDTVETPVTDNITEANEATSNQAISQNDMVENNSESVNTEKQDFTLDYEENENNKQEETQNNYTENNVDNATDVQKKSETLQSPEASEGRTSSTFNLNDMVMPVNNDSQDHITESSSINSETQELEQNQVDQINNISETLISEGAEKNPNKEIKEVPGIATLSLDQILDSELNSNPQYADNSKAVPKNVPLNSGFFNKKTVGIIVMTLILGVFVAVFAYPSKKNERKEGDIVQYTGSQIMETDHYSGDEPIEGGDEYTGTETDTREERDDILDDILNEGKADDIKHSNPKVAEFPDRDPGEDDIADSTVGEYNEEDHSQGNPTQIEPIPYNCTDDNCEEELQEEEIIVTTDEIEQTISNYKSEAEKYYEYGDNTQDKKLVKYALQIINLCDAYQGSIENGGQNTQKDFEEFKSKIVSLKSKIEKYIGGGEEVETFIQSSFKDEYDFEGKDELLDFINGEDS